MGRGELGVGGASTSAQQRAPVVDGSSSSDTSHSGDAHIHEGGAWSSGIVEEPLWEWEHLIGHDPYLKRA